MAANRRKRPWEQGYLWRSPTPTILHVHEVALLGTERKVRALITTRRRLHQRLPGAAGPTRYLKWRQVFRLQTAQQAAGQLTGANRGQADQVPARLQGQDRRHGHRTATDGQADWRVSEKEVALAHRQCKRRTLQGTAAVQRRRPGCPVPGREF